MVSRGATIALLLGCAGRLVAGEAGTTNARAFELRPGILADPDRPALYLMNPEGGIDAIGPGSGKVLWRTMQAAKPLALARSLLVAQAEPSQLDGGLRVVVLDPSRGGDLVREADVGLPAGVRAAIDDGPGTSFVASARAEGDGVIVTWRSSRRELSGMAPDAPPPALEASGAARIDLATGRVDVLTSQDSPAARPTPLSEKVARLIGSLPGEIVAQQPSADGRHLLVSRRIEGAGSAWEQYQWSIYALETGARVAEVREQASTNPFFVWGPRIVHQTQPYGRLVDGRWVEEPLMLRAVDLASGAAAWARPVRDTSYRGPYPAAH